MNILTPGLDGELGREELLAPAHPGMDGIKVGRVPKGMEGTRIAELGLNKCWTFGICLVPPCTLDELEPTRELNADGVLHMDLGSPLSSLGAPGGCGIFPNFACSHLPYIVDVT